MTPIYSDTWNIGDDRGSWLYTTILRASTDGWAGIVRAIIDKSGPILDGLGCERRVMMHTPGGLDGNQIFFHQLARAEAEFGSDFLRSLLKGLERLRDARFAVDVYLGYPLWIHGENPEEYAKRSGIFAIDPGLGTIWIDTLATLPPDSFGDRLAMLLREQGYTVGGEGCPGIAFNPLRVDEPTARHQGQFPVMIANDDPHLLHMRHDLQSAPVTLLQHAGESREKRLEDAMHATREHPGTTIATPLFLDWQHDYGPLVKRWGEAR